MRMWIGKEREGKKKGVETLFVEAPWLHILRLKKVRSVAKEHSISRIYIGAGKVDVTRLSKDWVNILQGFEVVVETTAENVSKLCHTEKFEEIIVRTDLSLESLDNVTPKIDNGKKVLMYYGYLENSLSTVKDGYYTDTDILV